VSATDVLTGSCPLSSLQTCIAPEVVSSCGDSRSANDVNAADVPDNMAPGVPISEDRSALSSLSTVVNVQPAACATDPPLTLCPSPSSVTEDISRKEQMSTCIHYKEFVNLMVSCTVIG